MAFRVLGYRQGGAWAAHCLETDLVGRGRTFAAAIEELKDLTVAQISFARQMRQPLLLDHPAPARIIRMYTRVAEDYLRRFPKAPARSTRAIGSIALTELTTAPGTFARASA